MLVQASLKFFKCKSEPYRIDSTQRNIDSMSKSSKAHKSSNAKDDDDEEEEYLDDDEYDRPLAESKVTEDSNTGNNGLLKYSRDHLQHKAQMLEEELDRETDEEFERMRISTAIAKSPPKVTPKMISKSQEMRKAFKIHWLNMRDSSTGEKIWESRELGELLYTADPEYDEVTASVPKEILKCKSVSRELNFTSGMEITKLRLEQRVFFHGHIIEECAFVFGYVIPGSNNTWQQVIEAASPDKMLTAEALSGKVVFETCFYDDELMVCKYSIRMFYV